MALVGGGTASGFRAALRSALPGEREAGTVLHQLLDDLPNALMVSGHALAVGLSPADRLAVRQGAAAAQRGDICAGWITGGTIMTEVAGTGIPPPFLGPAAPGLLVPDDPLAWHPLDTLPPTGIRRARRIDVWLDGEAIAAEAFFRDSHVDGDSFEEVVHEYTVHASVDAQTLCFTAVRAEIGVLPFAECPAAAASAGRLVGQAVTDLRSRVRGDFTGPSTCTHLNDILRSLEDLPALIRALPGQPASSNAPPADRRATSSAE